MQLERIVQDVDKDNGHIITRIFSQFLPTNYVQSEKFRKSKSKN